MTREVRREELNVLRQKNPQRLIATYRSATNTPEQDQLPRGMGFSGMIEAILEHEFSTGTELQQVAEVAHAPPHDSISQRITPASLEAATHQRDRYLVVEFRAFCSGAAIVCTGLVMAGLYLLLTRPLSL